MPIGIPGTEHSLRDLLDTLPQVGLHVVIWRCKLKHCGPVFPEGHAKSAGFFYRTLVTPCNKVILHCTT